MRRPRLDELSLKEKISQLLMIHEGRMHQCGVEAFLEAVEKYQYGSMWISGGANMAIVNLAERSSEENVTAAQNKEWLDLVQSKVRIPMLFGADSESGIAYMFSDATETGTAYSVGATDSEQLAHDISEYIAREAKAGGNNWRWGPVVDMPHRLCAVSNGRYFSADIDRLTKLSIAAVRGVEKAKVATTVKHFPGTDPNEIRDGHFSYKIMRLSLEEWEKTQGKVFQNLIDAGVMSIMTTHISFPAVDDEKISGTYVPCTLSKKITQGLLREKMGFDGVIITDGFEMAGLSVLAPRDELLIRTINAGHDVILGVDPEDYLIVEKAVLDGRIPMSRIDESCERVLTLKEKIGLFDDESEEVADIAQISKKTREINNTIAEKSITLLYDNNKMLPLDKDKIKNVAILSFAHDEGFPQKLEVLVEEFAKRGAKAKVINSETLTWELAKQIAEDNDLIIYAGFIATHRPYGMPSFYGTVMQSIYYAFSYGNEKSLGVSMGYPYIHFDSMTGAKTFINIYSPSAESQIAFAKAIYGEIPFEGKSPVDIEPKLRYVYC